MHPNHPFEVFHPISVNHHHIDLTHKSSWFLVCVFSSSVFQSLYRMFDSVLILPTAFWEFSNFLILNQPFITTLGSVTTSPEPFYFYFINFNLNFKINPMTVFILSQFDIVSNLAKTFSLTPTKLKLHPTSRSLISNEPRSCSWFHKLSSRFKKAGPSNHCLTLFSWIHSKLCWINCFVLLVLYCFFSSENSL